MRKKSAFLTPLTQVAEVDTVPHESVTLARPPVINADMNIFQLEQSFVKTIIADTIETYSGQWRLVHEALQNAHDHIQLNSNITEGVIEVYLSVASNMVTVKDNGTGIEIGKFSHIFLLGGSDKTETQLRKILKGSQGVGIKSTLFTSTLFRVETVHSGESWKYELKDCYKYKDPSYSQDIVAPKPNPLAALPVPRLHIHLTSIQFKIS